MLAIFTCLEAALHTYARIQAIYQTQVLPCGKLYVAGWIGRCFLAGRGCTNIVLYSP